MPFANATPGLTATYKLLRDSKKQFKHGRFIVGAAGKHDGNHAPRKHEWFDGDDTLDREGASRGKRKAHGICKGIASGWVIAFLNGVRDTTDPLRYEQYYMNFLRFQATMIKDFGGGLDEHVAKLAEHSMDPNIKALHVDKPIAKLEEKDIPAGKWAAYISCWGHDIAVGGTWGSGGKFYINEPNSGLHGYGGNTGLANFLNDLDCYLEHRRNKKHLPLNEPAHYWIYQPK